jgi:hypothetical protein
VNRFRTIAVTAVAGLALVACGSASSSSGEPSSAASVAPSEAQASSGGGVLPSLTAGAVADLEALIPDTVGELTITKQSVQTSEFLTAPGSDPAAVKFVEDLGVSPSDISIATGTGSSADLSSFLFVFVIRAQGADSDKLVSAFKTASSSDGSSPMEWASSTVAGKSVEVSEGSGGANYIYAKGDVMFWLIVTNTTLAEQFFAQLP